MAYKGKAYFSGRLAATGPNPLLLTTGRMAPEAYSLDAAISEWIEGKTEKQIRKAAVAAYNKYQKTGQRSAERLFNVRD